MMMMGNRFVFSVSAPIVAVLFNTRLTRLCRCNGYRIVYEYKGLDLGAEAR